MAYKFSTGSVNRGDIYAEDDVQRNTYIDWTPNGDSVGIVAGGTTAFVVSGSTTLVGVNTTTPDYTLDVAGTVGIDDYIYHNGDTDTYLKFTGNEVNIVAGGQSMIKLDYNNNANDKIQLNNTNANIDVQIMDDDGEVVLHTDAGTKRVGIREDSPTSTLHVSGSQAGNFAEFNSDWTLDETDFMANFTGTSGLTASLPAAAAATKGRIYHIFSSLNITGPGQPLIITATSGQTIGNEAQSLGLDNDQGNSSISLVSDGSSNWMILGLYSQSENGGDP